MPRRRFTVEIDQRKADQLADLALNHRRSLRDEAAVLLEAALDHADDQPRRFPVAEPIPAGDGAR